jgi:LysR family transcriptional regulator, regulator for genes of the gallate degradation pathway
LEESYSIPSLRHMRVFESVARLQSVSRASSAVNLSQPAISQAIANLEERFGVRLLERHHTGSLPSEYGEILLFRIRRMHMMMLHAIQEFVANTSVGHNFDPETMLGKITLTQIRSLIAVSENISFDQAARSIGISQPSLHRAARDLEKLLRGPLYTRVARGTTTTRTGGVLARRFNVALGEIRSAREEIDHRKGVLSASLLVGTLSTSGAPLLGRAIDLLLTHYPGLTVKVVEEPYEHLLNDLLLGNIDFLFSILRRPDWATDVVEETLYRDDYVVVCRPGHPLNVPGELSLKDLARYRWIIPGPATPRSQAFHGLFAKQRRPVTDIVTTSRAITRAVIAGSNRLTLLTRHEARSEEALGVMRVLPFACKIPAPAYGVATRMDWAATTTQQQFLEILRDLAAETGIPAQPAVAGA